MKVLNRNRFGYWMWGSFCTIGLGTLPWHVRWICMQHKWFLIKKTNWIVRASFLGMVKNSQVLS